GPLEPRLGTGTARRLNGVRARRTSSHSTGNPVGQAHSTAYPRGMRSMDGEQVTKAVTGAVAALRAGVDQDWSEVIAGRLEWTCRRPAAHVAGARCGYAGQLAARARDARVPLFTTLRDGVDNDGILQSIETAAALLATVIAATPREVRGFHPLPFRNA